MKRLILASAMFVVTGSAAFAEAQVSGNAWMGILNDFGSAELQFDSSATVTFTMAGESDGGLAFGATFDADAAAGANLGTDGYVYISGTYGKLSMGDVDGAALAAVGQVSEIGVTGLSSYNELVFFANGGDDGFSDTVDNNDPSVLYEYATGDWTFYVSSTNPGTSTAKAQAVGVLYEQPNFAVSGGYEMANASDDIGTDLTVESYDVDSYKIAFEAIYDKFYGKIVYGHFDGTIGGEAESGEQLALSLDYTTTEWTFTGFYSDDSDFVGSDFNTYGIGASYDLGGGATIMGGVANNDSDGTAFDLGVDMTF